MTDPISAVDGDPLNGPATLTDRLPFGNSPFMDINHAITVPDSPKADLFIVLKVLSLYIDPNCTHWSVQKAREIVFDMYESCPEIPLQTAA